VTSSQTTRKVAAGLGVVGVAGLLSGCEKPLPKVTIQSGSASEIVSAQPVCVTQGSCNVDGKKAVKFKAASGSTILIDVPRDVARHGWLVKALAKDDTGKLAAIDAAGSVPTKQHTVRLLVPSKQDFDYILQVVPVVPKADSRTWVVTITTS
jgi:hypothetical protein